MGHEDLTGEVGMDDGEGGEELGFSLPTIEYDNENRNDDGDTDENSGFFGRDIMSQE